jgi:predicted Zn finger-like uncharacterized protein
MSLITRCPACGTMFKVVRDQLRISEGWVRCGHCSEVFEAPAHMVDAPQEHDGVPAAGEQEPQDRTAAAPPAVEPGDVAESDTSEIPESVTSEIPDSVTSEIPDSVAGELAVGALADDAAESVTVRELPEDRPFELRREDIGGPHAAAAALLPEEDSIAPAAVPAHEREPELHDLSFVKQAQRKAFWTSRAARGALVVLAVVLLLLLGSQIAYHDRDRLAATNPDWRPSLVRMCGLLRCTVDTPRAIETIAIDNSSFNRLRGDAYRLNVTLRNQSATPVAVPALELTLTDGSDQAVIRRVLAAADFAPAPTTIAPRGEWSATVALSVNANGLASRLAGYRVLAFYP